MNALEQQLVRSGSQPESLAGDLAAVDEAGISENLATIHVELDSVREPRLTRLLRRVGVPDLTVPLITATPALRRSWFVAVVVALLFALSATTNQTGAGPDRIILFLTLAPLIPLLGVALAFGPGVDPTHDLVLAAPRDSFTVFLIRALTVLASSSAALLIASVLLPEGGPYRLAWLLPSVAVTAITMVLSAGREPRRVAAAVAVGWIALVVIVSQAFSPAAMFGVTTQLVSLLAAAVGAFALFDRRGRFDDGTVDR